LAVWGVAVHEVVALAAIDLVVTESAEHAVITVAAVDLVVAARALNLVVTIGADDQIESRWEVGIIGGDSSTELNRTRTVSSTVSEYQRWHRAAEIRTPVEPREPRVPRLWPSRCR
jgi:hypothetical protein